MGYFLLWLISWLVIGFCLYRLVGKESLVIGIGGGFIGSLLFLIFILAIWPFQSEQDKAAAEATKAASSVEDACHDDWHRCTDNAMLVNNWRGIDEAREACKRMADEQAKWGHPTFSSDPFTTFAKGNTYVPAAEMMLIDRGGGFYNGFGALQRVDMVCGYDLKLGKVVDFAATPRS